MENKEFYPGKIMYSGLNGTVKPIRLSRSEETEQGVRYFAQMYYSPDGWDSEYEIFGLKSFHNTREEAINFALAELSKSIAKLPSIDELRDLEMSAQPSRYDLSNVFE